MVIDKLYFFSQEQGNLLIRLLLAHILAEFALQSKKMVEKKRWLSKEMGYHISIVFIVSFLLSVSWKLAVILAFTHWLIDSSKNTLEKSKRFSKQFLFISDQTIHIIVIICLWCYKYQLLKSATHACIQLFCNYHFSLLVLAYAIVIWPLGYLIAFALQKIVSQTPSNTIEQGGKLIGQFERIIILTFVLLGQYAAIGFLITGKSIIRFADKNSDLKSEYVLVGTMMSYALSIFTGLIASWLLKI